MEIEGSEIKNLNVLTTLYGMDTISVTDSHGVKFRIHVDELLKLIKKAHFVVEKKRNYTYLKVIGKAQDNYVVTCTECKQEFSAKSGKWAIVEKLKVLKVFLQCPSCGHQEKVT